MEKNILNYMESSEMEEEKTGKLKSPYAAVATYGLGLYREDRFAKCIFDDKLNDIFYFRFTRP